MRCRRAEDRLDAYLAGELSPPVRGRIEAHLASCENCRGRLDRLAAMAEAFKSAVAPPVPDGFAQRVMLAARSRRPARALPLQAAWPSPVAAWRAMAVPMRAAAAAVLVAGLGLGVLMGRQTSALGRTPATPSTAAAEAADAYHLDAFEEAPGGSLAQACLAVAGGFNGEGN